MTLNSLPLRLQGGLTMKLMHTESLFSILLHGSIKKQYYSIDIVIHQLASIWSSDLSTVGLYPVPCWQLLNLVQWTCSKATSNTFNFITAEVYSYTELSFKFVLWPLKFVLYAYCATCMRFNQNYLVILASRIDRAGVHCMYKHVGGCILWTVSIGYIVY